MNNSGKTIKFLGMTLLLSAVSVPSIAFAQLDSPWSFSNQNRASIAALMKQIEDQSSAPSVITNGGGGDITSLVCGGDAQSSADGNSSCIILNNSDADIYLGQDSQGDQTATNEETTTVDETINSNVEAIDDVLDTLSGG